MSESDQEGAIAAARPHGRLAKVMHWGFIGGAAAIDHRRRRDGIWTSMVPFWREDVRG